MTNCFGSGHNLFPLIDPRSVREYRAKYCRCEVPELAYANSYYQLAGRRTDVGWLLLDRGSYNQINPYANDLQLTITDFTNTVTISNISIVQASCVTRGLEADPNAVYLVQVTSNQGILSNPWFEFPLNAMYNVRAPAYDGSYYSGSLNGTAAWTWSTMVQDIWNRASALLGAYPGLPISPIQAPENYVFVGVPLWDALNNVMDFLGLSIVGSYPSFSIVQTGLADAAFAAQLNSYDKYLEDSAEYLDLGAARVPKEVVVYFRRRNQAYGTEETVRYGGPQWMNAPAYSITVPAPGDFVQAKGTAFLWADQTIRFDHNGNPLGDDLTQALATARERVSQYFAKIYRGTQGYFKNRYTGTLPFTTGSLVDGVRWYWENGWHTEVARGFVWKEAEWT